MKLPHACAWMLRIPSHASMQPGFVPTAFSVLVTFTPLLFRLHATAQVDEQRFLLATRIATIQEELRAAEACAKVGCRTRETKGGSAERLANNHSAFLLLLPLDFQDAEEAQRLALNAAEVCLTGWIVLARTPPGIKGT